MKPSGMIVNRDGYLRIKRGPRRDQLAHRAYVARQIGVEKLTPDKEVHHECHNRCCWPPTDFHLVLVDAILAPYMYQRHALKRYHNRARRRVT